LFKENCMSDALRKIADRLLEDYKSFPEGVSAHFLPKNPANPITDKDMENARKLFAAVKKQKGK